MEVEPSTAAVGCPQCGAATTPVTSVTVRTLGTRPRRVLVTRRCNAPTCQLKFPVLKVEDELSPEERACWHEP